MAKVIVGMSGGVDSSVSAYLLKAQGHEVVGVFMRNWDSIVNNDILGNLDVNNDICPQEKDYQDALKVAKQLGIDLFRVDFISEYYDLVFQNLIDEYSKGRTPNPDILCNKLIKFGVFIEYVTKKFPDYDFVAMGHYAKISDNKLYKPVDNDKDQTYFLAQLTSKQLAKVIFPLANLTKQTVRKIAHEQKLFTADKKDSTGICFIGERKFTDFLKNYIPAQPGKIVDIVSNEVVGNHEGVMYYTIGQRRGLNLGGLKLPYYVAGHNLEEKIIYVANDLDNAYLQSNKALITNVNWIIKDYKPKNLTVKFRYKSPAIKANIKWVESDIVITYASGFSAVTPGQQCVFYDDDLCLGGGIIDQVYLNNERKTYV